MIPSFERSNALQARLHQVVPGGAHTFAKGSDQYPEGMAPVLVRGHGARVWDVDGNEFVEYGMGMRAVTLGHGYAPVLDAVRAALADGVSFSRPTVLELAAAEDFLAVVPGADMVKFCKNASDATSAALRLARAATGREIVAMCADQPYFSSQDWFVGTLPMSTGVPAAVRSLVRGFRYNDLASLQAILEAEPVACVILEAASALAEPEPGLPRGRPGAVRPARRRARVRRDDHGLPLGRGRRAGGVRRHPGPVDVGQGDGQRVLDRGARRAAGADGARRPAHGPAAGVPAVEHERRGDDGAGGLPRGRARLHRPGGGPDPVAVMERQGRALADGVNAAAAEAGIGEYLSVLGRPSCLIFRTADATGSPSQAMRTLFLQEILRHGVLGPVVRDLGGAHRRGRRADRRGRAQRDAGLPQGAGDRPARGAVRRAAGRPGTPADGRAAPAGPGRPGRPAPPSPRCPIRPLPASPR